MRRPSVRTAAGRTRPPARPALQGVNLVHALTADGMLHSLYVSNGRNRSAPIRFLPANANARGLIIVDGIAYVATSNQCGGAPDGVWALDLESGRVTTWTSEAGAVVGPAGMAIGPDGTVYAATRNGPLVALEARSLQRTAVSASTGFRSSPVVFDYEGRDHVAAIARNGRCMSSMQRTYKQLSQRPLQAEMAEARQARWRRGATQAEHIGSWSRRPVRLSPGS